MTTTHQSRHWRTGRDRSRTVGTRVRAEWVLAWGLAGLAVLLLTACGPALEPNAAALTKAKRSMQADPFADVPPDGFVSLDEIKEKAAAFADQMSVTGVERDVIMMQYQLDEIMPSLERLLLIEEDIRQLLATLANLPPEERIETDADTPLDQDEGQSAPPASSLPALNSTPEPGLLPAPQRSDPPPLPGPAPNRPGSGGPGPGGPAWSLHVGSYKYARSAVAEWSEIRQAYGDVTAGKRAHLSPIAGTTMQRMKIGPFLDRAAAMDRCRVLKREGHYCVAMRFDGVPL